MTVLGASEHPAESVRLDGTFCSRAQLERLRVAVIGLGALGNEVVRILGLLGLGFVDLVDPDRVEASNLTRSVSFRDRLGENKAEAMADYASRTFPSTHFRHFACEAADLGFGDLARVDFILGCTDTDLSRLEIAYAATRLNVPLIDGGLAATNLGAGRVSHFPGTAAACYSCMLTSRKRAELLTLCQSPVGACWGEEVFVSGYSSTPMMASIIAAIQVETALRCHKEVSPMASSVEVQIHPKLAIERLAIERSAACPFHDPDGERLDPPGENATVGEYLAGAGTDAVLVLDWPLCVRARCGGCDFRWEPMARMGRLHRWGACPACGASRICAEELIRELSQSSPLAQLRFRSVGLPPSHRYAFRTGGVQ